MTPDNKYSEVLLELKTHYQQTLAELEAQTNQIKARLTSLDTLIEDPLLGSDILTILQGEADSLTSAAPTSQAAEATKAKPQPMTPKASTTTSKKKSTAAKKSATQAKAKKKKTSRSKASSRPMLWPYTEMFKVDAIATIMQEKAGTSVCVDDLVLQLYGELGGDDLKTERDRVYKTMQSGVQKNRWHKDPEEPMRYIFEEKSEAKSKESKTAQT